MNNKKAHVIVISNEKGGTGKSTLSMHLAIKLMQEGFKVAAVDMDGRQGTLSGYISNRLVFAKENNITLDTPTLMAFSPVDNHEKIGEHLKLINEEIEKLKANFDAVIIDTPGAKNYLFDEAHKFADTLITPMTDSLIDLNALSSNKRAGYYAQYIWEVKKQLAAQRKPMLNWVVALNKVSVFNSKNKNQVVEALGGVSKLYGFRMAPAIKDRTIYKELFLQGLTVLDMSHPALKTRMSVSHIAAKQEINDLAESIGG